MNYQAVEETLKAGYREVSGQYRRDDEVEVTTENHRRIGAKLKKLCESFSEPIRVLDVGCGTGRYFHCLTNVRELLGIDISDEMLRAAEHPVLEEEISIPRIQLRRVNVYSAEFPAESFDLIYSLGVFGDGCGVTPDVCDKFHDWLAPGGKVYFNNVDLAGTPVWYRLKRRGREFAYPMLPRSWQVALDERQSRRPFFGLTRPELEHILRQSRLQKFQIESHPCQSPLGWGRHLECVASK